MNLKIGRKKCLPEVWRRPLHVDCGDLEADGLELCQEVEVHEVLLAEDAGALPLPVDGRRLDDQLHLADRVGTVLHLVAGK